MMSACIVRVIFLAIPLLTGGVVAEISPRYIRESLKNFHQNPKMELNKSLLRTDELGQKLNLGTYSKAFENFAEVSIQARSTLIDLLCRDVNGVQNCTRSPMPLSEPSLNDDVNSFFEDPRSLVRSIVLMQNLQLNKGEVTHSLWSDSYWPIYKGVLGQRYADPNFPNSNLWPVNYSYVLENSADALLSAGRIHELSPAEKYDLLVGDLGYSLSTASWNQGKKYFDTDAFVASWMGICHGWAAASINTLEALQAIHLDSPLGFKITFYPSDIRALASQLWASAPPRTRLIGGRCTVSRPEVDAIGRVIDPLCLGTNPGTWHVALVNHVGVMSRSMIMDATFDAEVWNYPISSYEYTYFNPQTLAHSRTLAAALVPIADFKIDKFKSYRSTRAAYVVGIAMSLSYAQELQPTRKNGARVKKTKVTYIYDLELDSEKSIIGGEWYTNFHPDFIWTSSANDRARAFVENDSMRGEWLGLGHIPESWFAKAKSAARNSTPLASIVERMIELSNKVDR